MVVAALSKQSMMNDLVNVQLIEQGITVLWSGPAVSPIAAQTRLYTLPTLDTDAVKMTTS